MHRRGKLHGRPRLAQPRHARQFFRLVRRQNAHRGREPGRTRALNDRIEVRDERLVGEVAVGIDQRPYLTRVPGAGGWSNVRSSGLPPSGLAASTMPLDSIPISFAGLRFATITT